MTYEQILADIRQRKFAPIYFLQGDEPYFIDKLTEALEATVLTEAERGFNQTILYGKDTDAATISTTARRFPMMSEYQLVVVREAQSLPDLPAMEAYFSNPSPQTVLVFNYRKKKLDERKKVGKALKKTGLIFTSKPLYDNKVEGWISKLLQSKQRRAEPEVLRVLAQNIGPNLVRLEKTVDKLLVNLGDGEVITLDHALKFAGIDRDFNVFELQKAVGSNQQRRAYQIIMYFGKNPKAAPFPLVIGSFYTYYTKILIAGVYRRKSGNELAKLMGLKNTYFLGEYQTAARHYSPDAVKTVLGILETYDLRFKGVGAPPTPPDELMLQMVAEIFGTVSS